MNSPKSKGFLNPIKIIIFFKFNHIIIDDNKYNWSEWRCLVRERHSPFKRKTCEAYMDD